MVINENNTEHGSAQNFDYLQQGADKKFLMHISQAFRISLGVKPSLNISQLFLSQESMAPKKSAITINKPDHETLQIIISKRVIHATAALEF